MICPNCKTENDDINKYCVKCAYPLSNILPLNDSSGQSNQANSYHPPVQPLASTPAKLLGIQTARLLITLVVLWLGRAIFIRLDFVNEIRIPDSPLAIPAIITILTGLVALVLLILYARSLAAIWPYAFPRASAITSVPMALIYLAIIAVLYTILKPIILAVDPLGEVLLWIQVLLSVIALGLLIWAGVVLYQFLPGWLASLQLTGLNRPSSEIACLNCGSLNLRGSKTCHYCGEELSHPVE